MSAISPSQQVDFAYDPRNRCVRRTSSTPGGIQGPTMAFYYDGWDLIEEYSGGVLLARYVHGVREDEMIAKIDSFGTVYYHTDAEGSVVALTDTSGTVVERYKYDAFGAPTILDPSLVTRPSSLFGNRFLFTGREWLVDLGLYDYRNRAYSPELGRFLQTDPKSFDADPSNLYRYCGNEPLDKTDPMGLYAIDPHGLTEQQLEQLKQAQKEAADVYKAARERVDHAVKEGVNSKEFKEVRKAFEKTYGSGTGTPENFKKYSKAAKDMETALRDDGRKGYKMMGRNQEWFVTHEHGSTTRGLAQVGGKNIYINTDLAFSGKDDLRWTVSHESAHNAGMHDYWYKWEREYNTVMTREEAQENADCYVEFANSIR